jgi:ethylene-insensitive protein 3
MMSKFDETKLCGDMDFFYTPFMEGDMIAPQDEPEITAKGVRRDTHTIMRVW